MVSGIDDAHWLKCRLHCAANSNVAVTGDPVIFTYINRTEVLAGSTNFSCLNPNETSRGSVRQVRVLWMVATPRETRASTCRSCAIAYRRADACVRGCVRARMRAFVCMCMCVRVRARLWSVVLPLTSCVIREFCGVVFRFAQRVNVLMAEECGRHLLNNTGSYFVLKTLRYYLAGHQKETSWVRNFTLLSDEDFSPPVSLPAPLDPLHGYRPWLTCPYGESGANDTAVIEMHMNLRQVRVGGGGCSATVCVCACVCVCV
jgi:hypothetical protein